MTTVTLGFRAHSGWTAAVALAGPVAAPRVIDRRRLELATSHDMEVVQVYHAAAEVPLAAAAELVARATAAAQRTARASLQEWLAAIRREHRVSGAGIVRANGTLPATLAAILRAHTMIHAAEGELYRQVVVDACEAEGLPVVGVASGELYERADAVLGGATKLKLIELGRGLGSPWAQDQKESALVAWLALAARP